MPNWIYSLSDDGITALVIVVIVGGDLVAGLLYRTLSHAWLPFDSARILLDSHRLVVTLIALVLAFSLLQAQTNIREIHAGLAQEASTLDLVDRELQQLNSPQAADLSGRLLEYGNGIVTEEWPLLATGHHSRRLDFDYRAMLRSADALRSNSAAPDPIYADLLKNLNQLGELRDQRIAAAAVRLPHSFWHAIEAMTLVSILLAAAIPAQLPYRLATLLPSAALAILIALVIIVDVPFKGQSAVRPTELEHVLRLLDSPVPAR